MTEDANATGLHSMMHLLMTDESNLQPSKKAEFFIYGGVFFPLPKLVDLHNGVATIRNKYGYKPEDEFKFDVNSKPKQVSREDFAAAKSEVLELASKHGLRFIAYVVLHDIARNASVQKLVSAGANTVIGRFQYFLHIDE